jgi:hypothetical protein
MDLRNKKKCTEGFQNIEQVNVRLLDRGDGRILDRITINIDFIQELDKIMGEDGYYNT